MKKLLLSLGTVAAIAAPVASVIACGNTAVKGTPVDASDLNANPALQALGAKDGSYTSTVNAKTGTGTATLTFTATKAGHLDGVAVSAGSKVIVSINPPTPEFSIDAGNGTQTEPTTADSDGVLNVLGKLIQPKTPTQPANTGNAQVKTPAQPANAGAQTPAQPANTGNAQVKTPAQPANAGAQTANAGTGTGTATKTAPVTKTH